MARAGRAGQVSERYSYTYNESNVGKFFVQNFGCRATQADGAAIEALLAAKGLEAAEVRAGADLVVLNTCTVTSSADDDVRQTIRRVHRENPDARILVTGCYAQRAPEELASLAGVEWVVGNSHKSQIAELVTGKNSGTDGSVRAAQETRLGTDSSVPYHGNIYVGGFTQYPYTDSLVIIRGSYGGCPRRSPSYWA